MATLEITTTLMTTKLHDRIGRLGRKAGAVVLTNLDTPLFAEATSLGNGEWELMTYDLRTGGKSEGLATTDEVQTAIFQAMVA